MAEDSGNVQFLDWSTRWSQEGKRKRMPTMQGTVCLCCQQHRCQDAANMPCPLPPLSAGVVARFTGVQGVIGMHGGLPPPDAFPFATLGGDLAPDTTTSTAAAPPADSEQLQRLDITDPALVALAQQYIMTPKASLSPSSVCLAQA